MGILPHYAEAKYKDKYNHTPPASRRQRFVYAIFLFGLIYLGFSSWSARRFSLKGGNEAWLSAADHTFDGSNEAGLIEDGNEDDNICSLQDASSPLVPQINNAPSTDKIAYVTVVCDDEHAMGSIAWAQSLRNSKTTIRETLALVSDSVNPLLRDAMGKWMEIHIYPSTDALPTCLSTKLHLFGLPYSKLVYMSADTLVLENVDELFDRPGWSAGSDNFLPDAFNSDVMVLEPSVSLQQHLSTEFSKRQDISDSEFFNAMIPDWFECPSSYRLPHEYNTLSKIQTSDEAWSRIVARGIKVIRYDPVKPWEDPDLKDVVHADLHTQWWKVMNEALADLDSSDPVHDVVRRMTSRFKLSALQRDTTFFEKLANVTPSTYSKGKRNAFFTLLCDDLMLDSTIVLAKSIALSGSKYPFNVLTLPGVSKEAREKLLTIGGGISELREAPELEYPFQVNDAKKAINKMCRYSKLHLWNMEGYDKIVYLDADLLVVKNVDDLFDWPEFSAVQDMAGTYNTGVFVLEPNSDTYEAMLSSYLTAPSYNRGDQGFINWFFTNPSGSKPQSLPPSYNTPIKFKEFALWPMQRSVARIIHFTSETKPWTFYFTPHPHWEKNFDAGWFYKWVRMHRKIQEELKIDPANLTSPDFPLLPAVHDYVWPNAKRSENVCDSFTAYYSRFTVTDQYSVLIGTWDRVDLLIRMIDHYRNSTLVHTIFVTWHNPKSAIPEELKAAAQKPGAPVEFLKQHTDSLNNRFNPIRHLKTKAVWVADEDVRVPTDDIDLAFTVWQKHPDRLVGFFPRSHRVLPGTENDTYPQYEYLLRQEDTPGYSMMLTKGMFASADFLYTYTCLMPLSVHAYVDRNKNCEDVAFNMMVSGLTGQSPLAVTSVVDDFGTTSGISFQGGHLNVRGQCMTDMVRLFGGHLTLKYSDLQINRFTRVVYRKKKVEEW